MTQVDWQVISDGLKDLMFSIDDFLILDPKTWMGSHVQGIPKARLPRMLVEGHAFFAQDADSRDFLGSIAYHFKLHQRGNIKSPEVPDFLPPPSRPAIEIVEEAIHSKMVSTEFILAWGTLTGLVAQYYCFLGEQERYGKQLLKGAEAKKTTTVEDQRIFYAAWSRDNGKGLTPKAREKCSDKKLVDICRLVHDLIIAPPDGWPISWFESFFPPKNKKGQFTFVLNATYRKLSAPDLNKLLAARERAPRALPPTDPKAYEKAPNPRG